MLIDIAQRGRSLGVILVGAQQTASRVASEVLENAALRVAGRLDAAEAERSEYGWMLPSTRARARLLKPGTMVLSQPSIPVPLVVDFPFPPWATRKEEVDEGDGDAFRVPPLASGSGDTVWLEAGGWWLVAAAPPRRSRMRVLHTSDWHVGKRLERHDRMADHTAVIEEVAAVADAEKADLVLHSGDLFDRPLPPVDSLRLGLTGLVRLAAGGRPVVVVAGNHDSPELFDTLAPFLAPRGVHLVGRIRPPDEGGVLAIDTAAGRALIACFPFLRSAQVVDFMAATDDWYTAYAGRVQLIAEAYGRALGAMATPADATFLLGHFMVGGVKIDMAGPRGERDLHIGQAYATTEAAIPATLDYVALGHIHAPQPVPGARVPAEYAGSLLQLDFGESGEAKRVVIVETTPGVPARVRSIELRSGRRLVRAAGTWESLVERTDLDDAFLDLTVAAAGPDPELMDRARERFPLVVKVRAEYPRSTAPRRATAGRPWGELYSEYHTAAHAAPPEPELIALFEEIREEVGDAAP
jgi:exonuclease SbcD